MREPPAAGSGPAEQLCRLPAAARDALERLAGILESDPEAPVSPHGREDVRAIHIADSLSGSCVPELAGARSIADLGSGAGLPGLALAAALPDARFDLIESTGRRCAFIERTIASIGLTNVRAVRARGEEWALAEGREAYDAVTARAVGSLAELAELAAPLLVEGGALIAWKGRRDSEEEAVAARAASRLGMGLERVVAVTPYAGSRDRHLHVLRKLGPTPPGLPRRPGMARKRPFGGE